jgi:hypothetical protein
MAETLRLRKFNSTSGMKGKKRSKRVTIRTPGVEPSLPADVVPPSKLTRAGVRNTPCPRWYVGSRLGDVMFNVVLLGDSPAWRDESLPRRFLRRLSVLSWDPLTVSNVESIN